MPGEAQVELLLDIREQMVSQTAALETLVARWRKPGRPRKKSANATGK
jgi:hypothetical protein